MRESSRAVGLTVLSAIMFGTSGTVQALGPSGLSPFTVSAMRLGFGVTVLALLLPLLGHTIKESWPALTSIHVYTATFFACVFQVLYFTANRHSGVALGTLITMGSIPLLTGLLGTAMGHRISFMWIAATLTCAFGLTLLALDGINAGSTFGIIAALLSAVAGAGFTLTLKHILDRGDAAIPSMTAVFLVAGVAMLGIAATQPLSWVATPKGILLIVWLGVIGMAIPNLLWLAGLGKLSPGSTATLLLAEPLTATVLGVAIVHETLSWRAIVGLVIVFLGLAALGISESQSGHE